MLSPAWLEIHSFLRMNARAHARKESPIPEDSLAALVLAVEMFSVLHLALLEAAPLLRLEAQQVVLPNVLGHQLNRIELNRIDFIYPPSN